jgi:hypothetical protein
MSTTPNGSDIIWKALARKRLASDHAASAALRAEGLDEDDVVELVAAEMRRTYSRPQNETTGKGAREESSQLSDLPKRQRQVVAILKEKGALTMLDIAKQMIVLGHMRGTAKAWMVYQVVKALEEDGHVSLSDDHPAKVTLRSFLDGEGTKM